MSNPDSNQPFEKRWLMFLIAPSDLLRLLHLVSNPLNQFAAGALPPDVSVEDVWFDEAGNYLAMMLESQFFEPVEVRWNGEMMAAASWPRAVFSLDAAPEDEIENSDDLWSQPLESLPPHEAAPNFMEGMRAASEREFRLRALTFSAAELLQILRAKSVRELPVFPSYPPESHVIGAVAQPKIGAWTLFLEHPSFEPCQIGQEEGVPHVEIPGDGHDMTYRIALPGAKLERRLDLNLDEL